MLKVSKYALAGLILQCLLLNVLAAEITVAQDIYKVKLQLVAREKSLKEIFAIIEQKTDFSFTYSSKRINLNQKLTLNGNQSNLGEIIESIEAQANLQIKQMDNLLLVKAQEIKNVRKAAIGFVRGRVIDEQVNSTLPGATIVQKGTNNGTTSDVNGEFFLRVPSGDVEIEVSYIGFRTFSEVVEVTDGKVTELEFKMISDVTQLKDVVITGVLQGQQRALNQQKSADNIKNVV
ncbi:MAG: hypothetical protein C0490_24465, partial [Marivirga sp.]|nr:hypothetical protein [Marivirga sp.]